MTYRYPIENLVDARCRELGLRRRTVVGRMYGNADKANRQLLARVFEGHLDDPGGPVPLLAKALDLPEEVVEQAVSETRQGIADSRKRVEEAEAAWRAAFRPHAIIIAENRIPNPLWIGALIGTHRLLEVRLATSRGKASYIEQAKAGVRQVVDSQGARGAIHTWGKPVGFVVNYTPDRAICCDLDGKVLAELGRAYQIGYVEMLIGDRWVPVDRLRKTGSLDEPDDGAGERE